MGQWLLCSAASGTEKILSHRRTKKKKKLPASDGTRPGYLDDVGHWRDQGISNTNSLATGRCNSMCYGHNVLAIVLFLPKTGNNSCGKLLLVWRLYTSTQAITFNIQKPRLALRKADHFSQVLPLARSDRPCSLSCEPYSQSSSHSSCRRFSCNVCNSYWQPPAHTIVLPMQLLITLCLSTAQSLQSKQIVCFFLTTRRSLVSSFALAMLSEWKHTIT